MVAGETITRGVAAWDAAAGAVVGETSASAVDAETMGVSGSGGREVGTGAGVGADAGAAGLQAVTVTSALKRRSKKMHTSDWL